MEWWQPVVSISAVALVALAAFSLKMLVVMNAKLAGMDEWRRSVERRVANNEKRLGRHSKDIYTRSNGSNGALRAQE